MMYRIEFPIFNKPTTPGITHLDDSFLITPFASGSTVKNGKKLIPLIGQPDFDSLDFPILDYFHLETDDKDRRKWEWCKNDIHQIYGGYSPSAFSLYISPKVKDILNKYIVAQPSGYVLSKLKYHDKKYDYYVFYCGRYCITADIIFEKSNFQISKERLILKAIGEYTGRIESFEDHIHAQNIVWKERQASLYFKKAVIRKYYDFFIGFDDALFYVSERLKNALEENGTTGIEFVEETDIEFHFLETPPPIGNNL